MFRRILIEIMALIGICPGAAAAPIFEVYGLVQGKKTQAQREIL